MGRLIVAALVAAGLWMGFWVVAQTALDRGIRAYLEGPQPGVRLAAEEVSVRGFPNRLDTRLTEVELTLPETGTIWTAPFVQLYALVYRPTEVIADLPPAHRVETPLQRIDIAHDKARASVSLMATRDLALDRATLVIDDARLSSSLGWSGEGRQLRLSIAETEPAIYRLGLEGLDIALDPLPEGVPGTLSRIHLDATAAFTRAWDRSAMNEATLPQITELDISDITIDWGAVALVARGELSVDGLGRPDGTLDLAVTGWQEALSTLTEIGLIPNDAAPALRFALGALADGDRLDVPLGFRGGLTTLGPLPIGPAPNLAIR